jgi:hypothetical protein
VLLIDQFCSTPDESEYHCLEIDAPPDVVWRALFEAELDSSYVVRGLMLLRSLPRILTGHRRREYPRLRLSSLIDAGFGKLGEVPERELLLGVTGRFWHPTDNLLPFRLEDFHGPVASGTAQAVWNFLLTDVGGGRTLLSTETRILCGDADSRRKFRRYWMLIRPFSGWIRMIMLRAVAAECGKGSVASARSRRRDSLQTQTDSDG